MQRSFLLTALAVLSVEATRQSPAQDGAINYLLGRFVQIGKDYEADIVTAQSDHDTAINDFNTKQVMQQDNFNVNAKAYEVEKEIASAQRELEEQARNDKEHHTEKNATATQDKLDAITHFNDDNQRLQDDYDDIDETINSLTSACDDVKNNASSGDQDGDTDKGDNIVHNDKTLVFLDMCDEIINKLKDDLKEQQNRLNNNLQGKELAEHDFSNKITFHDTAATNAGTEETTAEGRASTAEGNRDNAERDRNKASRKLSTLAQKRDVEIADFNEKMSTLQQGLEATKRATAILQEHADKHGGDTTDVDIIDNRDAASEMVAVALIQNPKRKERLLHLLNKAATVSHSRALRSMVKEVSAGDLTKGFLQKAVDMVEKMIQTLHDEQRKEDEKKAWCDDNIARTEESINTLNASLFDLTTDLANHESALQGFQSKLDAANQNVNTVRDIMEEQSETETLQKEECDRALKEHKKALDAVDRAKYEVRKQLGGEDDADQSQGDDIMEAIELAIKDLKKTQGQTIRQCSSAKDEAAEKERNNKVLLAENEQEVSTNSDLHERETNKKGLTYKKHKATDKELNLAQQYRGELVAPCEEGDSDYETRKQSRKGEREALEAVIPILECDIHDDDQDPACAAILNQTTF